MDKIFWGEVMLCILVCVHVFFSFFSFLLL